MRVSACLLLCLVVVKCVDGQTVSSPLAGFLQTVVDAFPVICDVFFSVFGEVNETAFQTALSAALRLVDLAFPAKPLPRVPEPWWGDHAKRDTSVRRFTVHFSDEMITDLRHRIHNRRNLTHPLHNAGNTYGTHAGYLAHFLDYWANGYDFGAREDWLNSFPQSITNIQGLDIHFIHARAPNPHGKKVLPLLMLHGFPVTAFEFVYVIQDLMEERDDCDFVFEMIVPHLPGYGYSEVRKINFSSNIEEAEATYKIGMAPYQMGIIMKNLMLRLGKPQFYIHAGDVGQAVGDAIAVLFPERVLGLHTNFPFSTRPRTMAKLLLGQLYPPAVVEAQYEDRLYPLTARLKFYLENFGYFHMQASKPDNVGHGLDDSPVAHASWLIQNLIMATDVAGERLIDGNLSANYNMDDFYDSFTVHWACRSMTTAARSYAEALAVHQDPLSMSTGKGSYTVHWTCQSTTTAYVEALAFCFYLYCLQCYAIRLNNYFNRTPTPVPFAAINFRHELIYQPDDFLRDKYPNLVQSNTLDFGGHFAGYQEPEVLADSIRTAVAKMEQFHGN
ncbi:juvenile hormone epoxide hydrolase-like [Cydia fagiglandana]|uniref:juvenile hormone epoxide hydrolase-like n=1 Tax=Cydia fagiglandana TaxID=1458189 RepID=UPI002FEDFA56